MTRGVLLAHAASTWAMFGLIWFVQVVHYPLFARVDAAGFPLYESAHASRTTLVVGPLMVVELLTAVWLAATLPAGVSRPAAWIGLGLVALIWLSTALLQVPQHNVLATVRGGLALWLLLGQMPAPR